MQLYSCSVAQPSLLFLSVTVYLVCARRGGLLINALDIRGVICNGLASYPVGVAILLGYWTR